MPADADERSWSPGRGLIVAVATLVALAILAAAIHFLSSASSQPGRRIAFTDSRYPNVDVANTRRATGSIRGATVSGLGLAWTVPIVPRGEYGGYRASPVVDRGVAYSQDLASNVQAIDMESGEVLWVTSYETPTEEVNGVVVADGRVFGATKAAAFALDQKTGEEIWTTPLTRSDSEQIAMPPGYHGGLVYVSTAPAKFKGGEVGVLWALDGRTGRKVWSFDTVPKGLWGHPDLNFGGGLSYPPAFDAEGSMYFGVGNPGPIPGTERYPWGSSRAGPNLYTDSLVKLDAKTGKLRWYYQVTPHSLCNWDVGSPVLLKAGGRRLAVAGGLSGEVVAVDRDSGKPVWKRSVGTHNGHDDDGLQAMRGDYSRLKTPMTVYPGKLGGVLAPLSASRSTVFVPVVNSATLLTTQAEAIQTGTATGELVALDAASGGVVWTREFSSPVYAAPTVVNDLVFAATFDGTMYAFDRDSGREMWKTSLPAGFNAGLAISGDTLLAPAGYAGEGQEPELLAYRLPD
jgi:outer membrane protein assembly factor BamB